MDTPSQMVYEFLLDRRLPYRWGPVDAAAGGAHGKGFAMTVLSYLDFDFEVVKHDSRYRGRVLSSPAGQAIHDFAVPFTPLELENFFLRVGRARRGTRRIGSPEMDAARNYGQRLFEAVFGGEVNACFRSALNEASRQEKGLRIRLRLTEAPELGDLAWEYLSSPALGRFLSLSVDTPLVRYLELPEPIRPIAISTPLRILVAIASPGDYPLLDVNREWRKLKEALGDLEERGLVTLEELSEGTLAALQKRLRHEECHVFHFIGHGGFNAQTQDGTLIFEDASGKGHAVSGEYLGTLLHDHRPLRLALLNACEGARTSVNDPFAGVAQTLVQQGVPAVIAMQFEITDEAAITLAHEFYGAIADGYPVDGALAEARKAIFALGNDIEWGTPVLYMRAPDGHIFTIEQSETRAAEPNRASEPAPETRSEPVDAEAATPPVEPPRIAPPIPTPAAGESAAGQAAGKRQRPILKILIPLALVGLGAALALPSLYRGVFSPETNPRPGADNENVRPVPFQHPKATPEQVAAMESAAASAAATQAAAAASRSMEITRSERGEREPLEGLLVLATKGDPEAQTAVGRLYAEGRGVPKDPAAARQWLEKAAAQGSTEAKRLLATPGFVAPPETIAPRALREQAKRGDADALTTLRRLAEAGDADAQFHLGQMLALGEGVPKNATEGAAWIRKAAAQGQRDAVAVTAKGPAPIPARNPRCSDLLEKQSLGIALGADERAILNKDCK